MKRTQTVDFEGLSEDGRRKCECHYCICKGGGRPRQLPRGHRSGGTFGCSKKKRKKLSPVQEWDVMFVLSESYYHLGEHKSALPHARRRLDLDIQVGGKGSIARFHDLRGVAKAEARLDDFPGARNHLNEAMAILKERGEDNGVEYGFLLFDLADLESRQEHWELALQGYHKAKPLLDNDEGREDFNILLNVMAICLQKLNRWDEAVPLYRQAVELYRECYGNQHSNYATSLFNLAYAYYQIKQFALAVPLYEESLAIRKRVFGDKHPDTIQVLMELAVARDALTKQRKDVKTDTKVRMCNNCLKVDKSVTQQCSCRKVNYCSEECSVAHWAEHKPDCIMCYSCRELSDDLIYCTTCHVAHYCSEECRVAHEHECVARCYHCRKEDAKLSKCGACHVASYCSPECQKKHWPQHKSECKKK